MLFPDLTGIKLTHHASIDAANPSTQTSNSKRAQQISIQPPPTIKEKTDEIAKTTLEEARILFTEKKCKRGLLYLIKSVKLGDPDAIEALRAFNSKEYHPVLSRCNNFDFIQPIN